MLTVFLATRNRSDILRQVLDCFRCLQNPVGGWKLVVVDNGSRDDTRQMLATFERRLPLHWFTVADPGKNIALNAGLELLEGDLAVFTDDDAFPHADWLVQLRSAADTQPEYSMFGGAVIPRWELPPPNWISWVNVGPTFGMNDPALLDGPMSFSRLPDIIGPNMAIRAHVFRSGIRFDSTIGPSGSNYAMGSETELILRMGRMGHKGWHIHGAVVEHLVRAEQLDKGWILQRAIRFGRGEQKLCPNPRSWWGFPRHLLRDIPKYFLKMIAAGMCFRSEAAFRAHWRLNYLRGIGKQAWLMRSHSRKIFQLDQSSKAVDCSQQVN